MCGIISYFSTEKGYKREMSKTLSELIMANTVRGYHSTGMFYEGEEDSPDIFKKAVPGYDFVELKTAGRIINNYEKGGFLVAHNRAATKGVVNANNAHPFQHGDITGVHNGTLLSWKALTTGTYDTDSEYIIKAIAEDGSDEVIPKLNGSFNLIWHDAMDNTLHICRNDDRKYVFGKVKGQNTILGASEPQMLYWIAGRNKIEFEEDLWYPQPMTEYTFTLDKKLNKPKTKVHKEFSTYTAPNRYGNNYGNDYSRNTGIKPAKGRELLTFSFNKWEVYNTSNVNRLGKFEGKTIKGDMAMLFGFKEDQYELNQAYEG